MPTKIEDLIPVLRRNLRNGLGTKLSPSETKAVIEYYDGKQAPPSATKAVIEYYDGKQAPQITDASTQLLHEDET